MDTRINKISIVILSILIISITTPATAWRDYNMTRAWTGETNSNPTNYNPKELDIIGTELSGTEKNLMGEWNDQWYEYDHSQYCSYVFTLAVWDRRKTESAIVEFCAYNDTKPEVDLYVWFNATGAWIPKLTSLPVK